MIAVYSKRASETTLEKALEPVPGTWINVTDPSEAEIERLQRVLGVPQDFITYPLDLSEMPRTERENGATLIVLRVPYYQGETADVPYITVPLGIILTDQYVVTVCRAETNVIEEIIAGKLRGLSTVKHNRFVLQILLITAHRFLSNVRKINRAVDRLEDRLKHSLQNRELLEMLKYQKSLVYFATALKSSELMLRHLQRSQIFHQYEEDRDLLDDVLIEVQQGIEMTSIASGILTGTMDAYASIISNNLNSVMKVIASMTIVLNLPVIVSGFYGMNVDLPFQEAPWAFWALLVVAVGACALALFWLWRRHWL